MRRNRTEWLLARLLLIVVLGAPLVPGFGQQKAAPPSPKAATPLATAKAQLDRKDIDSAEKTLWGILSSDPANQDALTMLGVVRGQQQRYAEAEALFRRVLQLNPKSIAATRNLASALLAQDKPDEALQQYRRAIELSPGEIGLRIDAVQIELARENFADALSLLDGIKPGEFPPSVVPFKAAALMGLGKKSAAESLIPLVKPSPGAALDLAQVFVEANDPDAALKCLALVGPAPKALVARADLLRGRALRQKGDTSGAIASFRKALAADPKSTAAQLAIAEALAGENKHAESLRVLEQARAAAPESAEVLRHLVVEGMLAGQNERALQAAMDLQRVSPNLDDRYLVSTVMLQQKQYVPASHILEDYVAQRPDDAKAYLGLGIAYLSLLRYTDARQALDHSLKLNPNLAETQYQLGLLASQQGNQQEAVQFWERAVDLQPKHAKALFSLGAASLETGELAKAQNLFERSLAVDPTNMKTEYDLALVLGKMGKSEESKIHLERYRKMQEAEHAASGSIPQASSQN
jgi:tetratricopeptide (TPR) repeat protein